MIGQISFNPYTVPGLIIDLAVAGFFIAGYLHIVIGDPDRA